MTSSAGSSRESSKQRALRIPLDYYRRLTRLDRVKWSLTAVSFLAAGAYSIWVVLGWSGGATQATLQLSPGHLAAAHSAWDSKCDVCHEPGVPMRSDAVGTALLRRLVSSDIRAPQEINDLNCIRCHAGHAHHPRQRESEVPGCATCHRDHQGTGHDLRRVADRACVDCHGDLEQHRRGNDDSAATVASDTSNSTDVNRSPATKITSLADHPPFRSLPAADPGRIKFNHRLHLLPGQYPRNAKSSAPKRLDSIERTFWPVLGYSADTPPDTIVQLDCNACHEADPSAKSPAVNALAESRFQAVPSVGDYQQPIRYDRHCAACHDADLQVTIAVAGGSAKGTVPHGLRPTALRQQIAGIATARQAFESAGRIVPPRPVPGRTSGANLAQTSGVDLAIRLRQAERELRADHRCGKCHSFASAPGSKADGPTAVANDADAQAELPPDIAPASIPAVWLPKARFDHAAHRAFTCFECHDRDSLEWTAAGKPPLDSAQPLIPGLDNCRRCHFSSDERAGVGARTDCVECHRYHAADRRPTGAGAHSLPLPRDQQTNGSQLMPRATRP